MSRSARQIRGLGWTMDDGRSSRRLAREHHRTLPLRRTLSCLPREKGCIKFQSARSMLAL